MTNKYLYFVANWKMYGDLKALNSLDKVINFSKSIKHKKLKLIYCPPSTLINSLSNKLKNTKIEVGAQNSHESDHYGAYTGQVNSKMLKMLERVMLYWATLRIDRQVKIIKKLTLKLKVH